MLEYAVLNRLADGEMVREAALRSASGAPRAVLQTLLRKKWIAREDLSDVRDATPHHPDRDAEASGGQAQRQPADDCDYLRRKQNQRATVDALRELAAPRTTLQTLVRRGVVEFSEEAAGFRMSGMKPRKLEFLFTPAQKAALDTIVTAAEARKFLPMLFTA